MRPASLLATVAVALAVGACGNDDAGPAPAAPAPASEPAGLLDGIPQDGNVLGDPAAPVTLEEFADLQCPFCARFSTEVLPGLVREHVRRGRLRLVLRTVIFLGADSERGARMAAAAAREDRQWQFVERFYARQGLEGTGYATDAFLRSVAREAGVDVDAAFAARSGVPVENWLRRANARAETEQIDGTPSFRLGRTGSELRPFAPEAVDPELFDAAVRRLA